MIDTAELRRFAQVCRALSERARDPDDKTSWLRLARKWEQEATQDQGASAGAAAARASSH